MSKQGTELYPAKKRYQNKEYADHYDRARYYSILGKLKNQQTHATLAKALAYLEPKSTIVDIPCGTGRFGPYLTSLGYNWIGSDISAEMMSWSQKKLNGTKGALGHVRCDVEALPFGDGSVDCILSIRFLPHLPLDIFRAVLKEMRRATRQWLILDYKYRNPYKAFLRNLGTKVGMGGTKKRQPMEEIIKEMEAAGLRVHQVFRVSRFFSDNMILLCRKE